MKLALVILFGLPLAAQIQVSLTASAWTPQALYCEDSGDYCDYVPFSLSNDAQGDLTFTFPEFTGSNQQDPATFTTMNYLTTTWTASLANYSTLTITVNTAPLSGTPGFWFDPNGCTNPANVRPFFQRKGDNGSGEGKYAAYRWWANTATSYYVLANETLTTITVPLNPADWSDVNGQYGTSVPQLWQAALEHPEDIGITFGGGCFFGHGVATINGTAEFVLSEFTLQ